MGISFNWELAYCDVFLSLLEYHVDSVSHIKALDIVGYIGREKKERHVSLCFSDHEKEFDSKVKYFLSGLAYCLYACKATLNLVTWIEPAGSVFEAYGNGSKLQICKVNFTFLYFLHGYLRSKFCEVLCA